MNRLARMIIIIGAGIIVALLILLYFASQKMLQEIELRLNQSMSMARMQVHDAHSSQYGIQSFDYTPFHCSGLMDYSCRADYISIYMKDPLGENDSVYEKIRFVNFTLNSREIKSRNYLSFNFETDIEYPDNDKFFGDSKKDSLIAFFNHSAEGFLPEKLSCNQNYTYDYEDSIKKNVVRAYTQCDLTTQLLSTNVAITNLFTPDVERPHILGILYEIAMAINGDSSKEELRAQSIPHELYSMKITMLPKKSFATFLQGCKKLSQEQKETLQNQFDGNMSLIRFIAMPALGTYLGASGIKISQAISDLAQSKLDLFSVTLELKDAPKFQPLKVFKGMSFVEWLAYFNTNYNIDVVTQKRAIEPTEVLKYKQESEGDSKDSNIGQE